MLVYGDPGAGKTVLAGTAGKDMLIIRPPTDHVDSILGSGAKEMVVHDWEQMDDALEYCRHEGKRHKWIALDSLSGWQDTGLSDIWETVITEKPARKRFRVDKGEYGVNMWRIEEWIRHAVADAQFNFLITCWPFHMDRELVLTEESDTAGGEIMMPWVQGKAMPQKICGMMNLVGLMEVRTYKKGNTAEERRCLYVNKTDRYYAKNQFRGAWPDGRIWDPSLPKIEAGVKGITPVPTTAGRRRSGGRTKAA